MEKPDHRISQTEPETSSPKRNWNKAWIVKFLLPAVILVLTIGFAKHQIDTRPRAAQQKPSPQARLVTVEIAQQADHTTVLSAMGTVIPAKSITLTPEVTGKIISISRDVVPGGLIHEGQELFRIDSRDYETVVQQRQSELAQAQLNLKLEYGSQAIAQHEYTLLAETLQDQDRELVLRVPHLDKARAALEAATAALAKAQLDVQRCLITAPFNAIIQDKLEDIGARVSASTPLLTLVGTDEYWIEALVPVDQLQWIRIPRSPSEPGASVKVYNTAWGDTVFREGTVIRLLGQLESQGRMARLLVSVRDPMCLEPYSTQAPPLLIGSYVRLEIEGQTLSSVIPLRRNYLRDGSYVWIMNDQDIMEIRPVRIVFRDKDTVYISEGIRHGERIVTTDISAPVNGMRLRLNDAPVAPAAESQSGQDKVRGENQ